MLKNKQTQPQVPQKPRRDPSVGREANPVDPNHWSFQVHETLLSALPDESLRVALEGGADNGLFCYVDNIHGDDVIYHSGKLQPDHIILEIQGQRIAGYTQRDANVLLQQVSHNGAPVMLKSVKSGVLPKDLRQYLTARFPKGSIDHDLQQTIRDNLYLRTVPCTTRTARPGEVKGVDYTFLSQKDFDLLEQSGQLLESGIFDGNQYGTPKPPKDPQGPIPRRSNSVNSGLPGAHLSSNEKRRRNQSNSDAPPNTPGSPRKPEPPPPPVRGRSSERSNSNESLGPLPAGWEMAFTDGGHPYFIDHATEQTHWLDPRRSVKQGKLANDEGIELPYGWEKVEDPHYGTYYIDHVNRKTQYEHPGKHMKKSATADELSSNSTLPRRGKLEDAAKRSASDSDMNGGRSTPPAVGSKLLRQRCDRAYHPRLRKHKTPLSKRVAAKRVFVKDPKDLKGDLFTTRLQKGERGLGFTIIGGEIPDEEFLQIKNVVRNGPAFIDGKLQTGDVLVHVNGRPVLGCTHQDIVGMFQTILPGDVVELHICRGYPLPFDPDDPNTEIITTIAVTPHDDTRGSNSPASYSSRENMDHHNTSVKSLKSLPDLAKTGNFGTDGVNTPDVLGLVQPAEILDMSIVRGEYGFGFTIADSVYGQKVKQILDAPRCKTLKEGDLLQEINNIRVADMTHSQIVQVLKECPKGEGTRIVVQRGGIPIKGKKPARLPDDTTGEASFNSSPGAYFFNDKSDPSRPSVNGEGYMNMSREVRDALDSSVPPRRQVNDQRPKTPTGGEGRPKTPTRLALQNDSRPKPNTNLPNSAHLPRKEYNSRDDSKENHDGPDGRASNSRPPPGPRFEPFRSDSSGMRGRTNYALQNPYERDSRFDSHNRTETAKPGQFRSRTPGPELMQRSQGPDYRPDPGRPKTPTAQDMRSKTPVPGMYGQVPGGNPEYSNTRFQNSWAQGPSSYRTFDTNARTWGSSIPEHSVMQNVQQRRELETFGRSVPGGAGRPPRQSTSFEGENPSPSNITRVPKQPPFQNMFSNQTVSVQSPKPFRYPGNTEDNSKYIEMNVTLLRQESGFGFRIIGGTEEGSQVAVGHIVPGGAADVDGRLRTGDEILFCDGMCVINSSHHNVVQLMGNSGFRGQVSLGIRRRVAPSADGYPYDITVTRRENEGFGFVIISSVTKAGSTIGEFIGRILENSPAERCGQLHVGDRILAVNGVDISHLHHEDIVNIIKESGYSVTLTVGPPQEDSSSTTSTSQGSMVNAHAYPTPNDSDGRRDYQSGYRFPPPPPKEINRQRSMGASDIQDGQMYGVELNRGHRGFGFSIRGGQEFNNMPLFVLRIAEGGAADLDGRLRVGDQLLEINSYPTESMTHSEAIDIIQNGGAIARLLVRRTGKPPPSFEPTSSGSRYQSSSGTMANGPIGQSSPYLGRRNVPVDREEHVYSNQPFRTYLNN